ncbi:hypothetical protein DEAC_c10970 [Desulfosporosinus acididurans]|uniref:Uncharacterized protein n=1 Tax=Desulfosporosinus acididurans TaxID=476652 RepID=A0A0J1FVZ2_9FIRM|nr:CBO0543 family protein [Desulfosporosinus acididurans]KLU67153.1 hypothetical protein DEAC_c10970 [Desulfosporosinus acididurans]
MEDAILTFSFVLVAWFWGDWKQWRQYYSTIIFWALGNMIYCYLTFKKPLWKFTTIIPESIANILMTVVIFPCVALLFLPYFPRKNFFKQLMYVCFWTFIFSLIEWWALRMHRFTHFNGWTLTYSVIFNFGMFILLKIHYENPRWAWLISIAAGVFIMAYFEIPF